MKLRGQARSGVESFNSKPVPWLKDFLKQRGIQSSGKRKADLVELCIKSKEIKVLKISEEEAPVDPTISVKEKLPMKGIWLIRLTWKIWVCLNGLKTFQTYLISDFLIFSIILLERIPSTMQKALKVTSLFWATSCTSMDTWKTFVIIRHNPTIVVTVISSLL